MIKSDKICLLPQRREFCAKISVPYDKIRNCIKADCKNLYITDKLVKKKWQMIIRRPNRMVYILTGYARIKIYRICGNVSLKYNGRIIGEFYVNMPYICSSSSTEKEIMPDLISDVNVNCEYLSKDKKYSYIVGNITIDKAE